MEKFNLNVTEKQLITYLRQGVSSTTTVLPSMSQVQNANELTLQDRGHSLLDFISRPIDVYKGEWTTSQNQNDELIPTGLLFPDLLYKNAQYQEKMRGFVGLRGRLCVKLMANPQRFQQGGLLMYYIPNYKNQKSKADMIRASLSGKSGCGHVVFNCEGGTEQTLICPYVNQHTFYNSTTDQGNFGAIFVAVYGKLYSTSDESVGFRIQAWLESPELEYPTAVMPVLTQGSEEESMHSNTADTQPGPDATLKDVVNDFKNFSLKPSYIAKTASNLLQLAGYQKPTNITGITRTSLKTNSYMANFGGEQMSHKMALAANNELYPMPEAGGCLMDEMNINTLCKVPCYYKTFQMNVVNKENYVLFTDNIHPAKFVQDGTDGAMNSTFIGYVSAAFGLWRGSINYHFTIFKTGFHSGSVRLTLIPGLYGPFNDPTQLPDGVNLDRCYQKVYDLKDLTEFDFSPPYVSTREFLNVVNEFSTGEASIKRRNFSTGVILMDVFIPLRAPETVNPFFDVIVKVSAGDDFTLANPTAPNIYPFARDNPSFNVNVQSFSMDSGTDRAVAMVSTNDLVGAANLKMSLTPSALCTGEVVTSIKNLLARAGTYVIFGRFPINTVFDVGPFDFQIPRTATTLDTPFPFDYIDYFSYLYGFYRGGVRLTMDPAVAGVESYVYTIKMRSSLNSYYPTSEIKRGSSRNYADVPAQFLQNPFSTVLVKPSIEGVIDIEVPFYSLSHVCPVLVQDQTQDQVEESNYPLPIITFLPPKNTLSGDFIEPTIYRSCSDDFRFQYILGPPQVHFINYEDKPLTSGTQFFDVDYRNQPATRVGNSANGLFGSSFTFPISPIAITFTPPNQFLATTTTNNALYIMPEAAYSLSWTATANHLHITNNPYTNPSGGLWLSTNSIRNRGAAPAQIWTKYDIVLPVGTNTQAVPKPCAKITAEVVTIGPTSIIIPSWSATAFTYLATFSLPKPLLVSKTLGGVGTDLHSDYIMIDAGRSVRISLDGPTGSTSISIRTPNNTIIGYIIYVLNPNVGYTPGVPTFSPTLVGEYIFPI